MYPSKFFAVQQAVCLAPRKSDSTQKVNMIDKEMRGIINVRSIESRDRARCGRVGILVFKGRSDGFEHQAWCENGETVAELISICMVHPGDLLLLLRPRDLKYSRCQRTVEIAHEASVGSLSVLTKTNEEQLERGRTLLGFE